MAEGGGITFTIHGIPVGKQRARAAVINGRARLYTPSKTVNYEADVARSASDAMGAADPFQGPVRIGLLISFPLPKSKRATRNRPAAYWHTSKPDASNILKAIEDAMNGIVYRDDSQIAEIAITKIYDQAGRASVLVTVSEIEGGTHEGLYTSRA
jgi:Holliday junction resolvase RusA-like endonuclease